MKAKFINLFKWAISFIIALTILSGFAMFYYNTPIHAPQSDKITNTKFVPNQYWSSMLEGFGYGKTDRFGYNNGDFAGMEEPDIVFMGSSQLEAIHVPYDKNFVYLLNKEFSEDENAQNDFTCMNLGISAHFFEVSASNFKYVAERYKTAKYVVIELQNMDFTPEELDNMLAGTYHSDWEEIGVESKIVQRIPYCRLALKKLSEFQQKNQAEKLEDLPQVQVSAQGAVDTQIYKEKLNAVIKNLSETAKEYDIQLIILHHNKIDVDRSGTAKSVENPIYGEIFEACCDENGISYLDVSDAFLSNYQSTFELPYGFSNTTPGSGHLNKTGHRIIFEELYQYFNSAKR